MELDFNGPLLTVRIISADQFLRRLPSRRTFAILGSLVVACRRSEAPERQKG